MADRTHEYIFNHVFLPPQLPHRDDYQNGAGDRALVKHLIVSCRLFRDLHLDEQYSQWSTILGTLRTYENSHRHNKSLSKNALKSAFRDVRDGAVVILHVTLQNCGLIIRKVAGDYIIESFEASPPAAEVLAAEKSIQWDFPSRAVAVPSATFEEDSFQASFTEFLEKASVASGHPTIIVLSNGWQPWYTVLQILYELCSVIIHERDLRRRFVATRSTCLCENQNCSSDG